MAIDLPSFFFIHPLISAHAAIATRRRAHLPGGFFPILSMARPNVIWCGTGPSYVG
jgi:hypothetical protein